MTNNKNDLTFTSPTFTKRIKSMLGVDFYRLFHTPLFYIFLLISAIIPALVSMGYSVKDPVTNEIIGNTLENIWIMIASNETIYVVSDISEYANMNMVFIFGGIMVSIFIGHDYKSGYVKQLYTTHSKKQDYMISKSISCAFAIVCMCLTYTLGCIVSGLFIKASFEVNALNLILAILSKMVMSLGWASLYTFINIIFRRYFGVSIGTSFFFGTGILIIGLAAIFKNSPILNIFLYGSSVNASLSSTFLTLVLCLGVSLMWSLIYIFIGTKVLNNSDVY